MKILMIPTNCLFIVGLLAGQMCAVQLRSAEIINVYERMDCRRAETLLGQERGNLEPNGHRVMMLEKRIAHCATSHPTPR